jgi:hypothetical protein
VHGLVDRLSHQLDFIIHRRSVDESRACQHRRGHHNRILSNAGEQKACPNEGAKRNSKKD